MNLVHVPLLFNSSIKQRSASACQRPIRQNIYTKHIILYLYGISGAQNRNIQINNILESARII